MAGPRVARLGRTVHTGVCPYPVGHGEPQKDLEQKRSVHSRQKVEDGVWEQTRYRHMGKELLTPAQGGHDEAWARVGTRAMGGTETETGGALRLPG